MTEKATFGAGCFWGVEARFRELDGVLDAAVGYMGGELASPTYEQVCTDKTGHAEVVEVVFDPAVTAYEALVREFFKLHDPTQVNRQGPDVGRQYRSVVFVHDQSQRETAEAVLRELDQSGRYGRPIATGIEPASTFWRAEEYHQQYLARKGGTCSISGH
jgi:peptide-methionine (S)-S-oxide reductase